MATANQKQDIFDNIIFTVLTTICSEDYLHYYGIYRPKPIKDWEKFKNQVTNQTIKPGMYPESFGGDVAHYHGVRKEKNGNLTIANGYPSVSELDPVYARGLDAQEDHSHGLCQVYALMYYCGAEKLLVPGEYYNNVITGMKWLKKFTAEHDWVFNDLSNFKVKSDIKREFFKDLFEKDWDVEINLSKLVGVILKKKNSNYVKKWFFDN